MRLLFILQGKKTIALIYVILVQKMYLLFAHNPQLALGTIYLFEAFEKFEIVQVAKELFPYY